MSAVADSRVSDSNVCCICETEVVVACCDLSEGCCGSVEVVKWLLRFAMRLGHDC